MKSNWRIWLTVLAVLLLGVFALDARTSAVAQQDPNGPTVQSSDPVTPKLSPALRDLPQTIPERKLDREEINPKKNPGLFLPDFGLTGTDTKNQDPLAPNGVNSGYTPAPIFTFEGQGNFNMYTPPDTTGDVGPNHYVQMVNVQTAVYNKSGTFLGSWPNNALWTGFGGPCENDNDGDPIVLYDDMADRWMLSQFAISTGLEQCVAISTTPDPTGTYYLYDFPMPDFPDYPKLGVWPDGYYMGTNTGYPNQYYAHVLDRASMLAGAPATRQSVGGNANFLMPADADGPTPPPAGMPGTFYTFYDGGYPNHPAGVDRLAIYEFDVDWATPANSTFGLVTELPIAGFNYTVCGFFAGDCVPQPAAAGGQKLDTVDPWPMVRLQYRNFGGYQAMVGNFTVDVDGTDWAGIRWFELRNPGAGWTLRQEGTFAPDADHRFMGSIAMDGSGNIALGYSVSSSSTNPAIRYTIHTMGDPLGTMQAEASMFEGGGVNQGPYDRWGDYSAMVVDPTDQCTFWYTNEYHDVPESSFMWNTRIGTFKVPGCTGGLGPTGTLDGNVYDSVTMTGIAGADIQATSPITYSGSTTSDANGDYAMMLPEYSGYDVTGSAYGYVPNTITSVGVVSGTTTTLDIPLTLATFYTVDGVVTDVNTGWPLYANIDINGYPGDSIWSDPETGYYSISLPEGITYTFDVAAWVPGYLPGGGDVGPLTADATENFALDVDVAACVAPGYTLDVNGTFSDFEGGVPPAGWTVVDNAGNGVVWTTIAGSGESGNYTNGSGEAATVSSDAFGTADFDTELQTNVFDTTGWPGMTLEYTVNYQNYANEDFLDVDISTDGGATWTNVLSWNEDHGAFRATPGEDVSLDLSANVGFANTVLRWHYYDPALDDWEWYAQIDDVLLGNVSCLPPADGGLVVGNVYDDNTLDALNGAMVDNKDGYTAEAVATPFDLAVDDAFYTIFSPSGSKTFTATLSGYATDVQSVTVVISDTVAQDFYLGAGWLDADPDSLHVTLDMGISTTVSLNLDNLGSAAADFDLQEVDDGFQPALVLSIPASDGNFPRGNAAPSAGAAPIAVMEGGVPLSDLLAPLGTVAYATEAANSFHTAFDLDVPEVLPNLGAFVPANFPGAGEFVNGLVYVADTGNIMYELDPATGAVLDTYPVTAPPGGETYSGMALDPTSGMVYASSTNISTSSIFTVDVETGIATLIGPITGSACNIAIAIDGTGQIYGYDICTDDFWAIDKNTGAGTSIGSIGFDANFGQGMGWDPATDQIYLVAFNSGTSQVELRIADRVTGNTVLMGVLGSTNPGGLVQLPWLGVPIGVDTDIPWLSEDPITGTISAAGTQMIDVTFDAGVPEVTQPGDYHATLKVKNDTPYGTLSVPVTMTVDTPADWGKLEGTVTGLGYCDLDPAALEDAEVIITDSGGVTSTLMTDPNGYFSRWLDEAGSPYAIGVSAAEHEVGYASGVSVSGGVTTTVDFDLRWLQPCVSVDPETYEVTVAQGYSTTVGLDIDNAGAVSTTFELVETNGGFVTTTLFVDMPGRSLDNNSMAKSGPETPSEREAYSFIMGPVTLSANTFDVLILTPDGDVSVLSAALAPFTDLSVTVWDAGTNGEPSVADLLAFDVVILGNDLLWNNMDKTIVGNNLADYIDQGGKIIEGLYIQSFDNWGFAGRYMTDGYSPFTLA
ncbi:MAG: carboxypeptidase-like regulatory domain-containing protein, partial [Chloroflexi bacterium]|nr:carboxypeptidase-like regulatory domain-containing protein [Chloroflexota bacterium]